MDKFSIQNELVPMMLNQVYMHLKNNDIDEVIDYLDSMKVTNEMVKEHLMGLSLDKKLVEMFDKIDSKIKSAFTRAYNKAHAKGVIKGTKAKNQAADDDDQSSDDDDVEVIDAALLDEDQIKEIKKGKQ